LDNTAVAIKSKQRTTQRLDILGIVDRRRSSIEIDPLVVALLIDYLIKIQENNEAREFFF
jgi:hypothetical protein